jgi:GDP-L-fucose synthase
MESIEKKVNGKKFLVTGGTGFFGTNFKEYVQKIGGYVVTVGSNYDLSNESEAELLFQKHLLDKFDYIIHGAALQAAGDWPLHHKAEQYDVNLKIHANTFKMWHKYQPQAKMIGIGSSCSYPKTKEVLAESDYWDGAMHESVDIYGFTKKAVSVGIEAYKSQYKLNGTTVIFATLYGPHDHFDPEKSHVVSALVKKFVDAVDNNESEVEVWGDGTQTRELIYVDDQIKALLSVLDYNGSLINIGTGTSITIKELAETIKTQSGFNGRVFYNTNRFVGVKHKVLDVTLAKNEFGWTSNIQPDTLENNLKKTIDWYKQNWKKNR